MKQIFLFFLSFIFITLVRAQWIPANFNLAIADTSIQSLIVNESKIYAGTWSGNILFSENNGDNWKSLNSSLPHDIRIMALAISGNNIFAATTNGVFLSSDNGISWSAINNGLTKLYVRSIVVKGKSRGQLFS